MHEKSQLQIYKLRIGLGLPQWPNAGSMGSVSGQRSKIPHASRYGQKKKGKLVELRETDKYIIRVVDINPPFSIINNLSWQKMIKGKLGLNIIKLDLFNNTLF